MPTPNPLDPECILASCHEPGTGTIWCPGNGDAGRVCTPHTPEVKRHGYTVREEATR